jgi:hypothetical protein
MMKSAKTSLGESDLLLIIEMCDEGIEKCDAREKEHVRDSNSQAAEWDRRLRERYVYLRSEILTALEQRRRALSAQAVEDSPPGADTKGHREPPSQ